MVERALKTSVSGLTGANKAIPPKNVSKKLYFSQFISFFINIFFPISFFYLSLFLSFVKKTSKDVQ